MQPPDPEHDVNAPIHPERAPRAELPDDTSRAESGAVSTEFEPGTGRRMTTGVIIAAGFLLLGFLMVGILRFFDERAVAKESETAYSAPPPVDVVVAQPATVGQDLVLPGHTAAWY